MTSTNTPVIGTNVDGPTSTDVAHATSDRRLAAVRRLDPGAGHRGAQVTDPVLDGIVSAAAATVGTSMSFISILDDDRQWLRARHGIDVTDTPRDLAICDLVVTSGEPLLLPDTTADARLDDNPLVHSDGGIRCYVAVPLRSSEGDVVGTLCCADTRPHDFDASILDPLEALGRAVISHLELRDANRRLASRAHFFRTSPDLHCVIRGDGTIVEVNERWEAMFGRAPRELRIDAVVERTHPDDRAVAERAICEVADGNELVAFRARARSEDGGYRWLEWHVSTVVDNEVSQATARDVTTLVEQEAAIQQSNRILRIIAERHAELLVDGPSRRWWSDLLDDVLSVTRSEYGFIGFAGTDENGPFLRSMAITNIAWDDETRRIYEESVETGLVFRNTATLFGEVLLTRRPLVANDVANDPRAGGRPAGHPPLDRFLGLPLGEGDEMIGMIGLANRPDPYDSTVMEQLQPLLAFLRAVIDNLRWTERDARAQREITAVKLLQERILEVSDAAIVAIDHRGRIELTNERARRMLPRSARPGAVLADCLIDEADRIWLTEALAGGGSAVGRISGIGEHGRVVPCDARMARLDDGDDAGVVIRLVDASTQAELDRSAAANQVLEARLEQMNRQQQNDRIVVETVELLQASADIDEALAVVRSSMTRLFPDARIGVYTGAFEDEPLILHTSSTGHRSSSGQGDDVDEVAPNACWALRTRRPHGSWAGSPTIGCRHGFDDAAPTRFCVPLSYDGEHRILIVIESDEVERSDELAGPAAQFARLAWMTQSLSGALTNVALRLHLERAALADPLTDLPNRRAFQREVERLRHRAERSYSPQALALIDLDNFKEINDRLGHDGGDRVLIDLAVTLRDGARTSDVPGRLGGDEFALFLDDIASEHCSTRIDRLRASFAERCRSGDGGTTISIGIVHSDDLPGHASLETMLRAADAALYEAKRRGRDTVSRWSPSTEA
jgi:diguanylate cyclase (GGDEF)-like protein/PAS domain S-box-containing protein